MSDSDRNIFFTMLRALGSLDAEMRGKADRLDLQRLHSEVVRLDHELEQRARDLLQAGDERVTRDVRKMQDDIRSNGVVARQAAQDTADIKQEIDSIRTLLIDLQGSLDKMRASQINWTEWGRWVIMVILMVGAILANQYGVALRIPKF